MLTAVCPMARTWSTSSPMRAAPSSSEYSVCVCKCTKALGSDSASATARSPLARRHCGEPLLNRSEHVAHTAGNVVHASVERAETCRAAIGLDADHLACFRGEVNREHADARVCVHDPQSAIRTEPAQHLRVQRVH